MKKFLITEEEKSRILGMHKSAIAKEFLNEGFQDPDSGITWGLNFKDQQSLDNFVSPDIPQGASSFSYQGYSQPIGTASLIFSYWATLALLGLKPSSMVGQPFETVLSKYSEASKTLSQNQRLVERGLPYAKAYGSLYDNTKWWTTKIYDPQDQTKKTTITRWEQWYRTYILPNNTTKEALILTTPTKPVTPTKPQ
jgi:hypothetical protein